MRILWVLTLLLLSPPLKALEQPWLILTEPFPPYFSPELPNNGWMHDLVVTALSDQGINVTIEYVAWSRAMRLTASGGAVAALGAYKTVQREQRYYYSKAIGKTDTGFFSKSTLALTTPFQLDDLKEYVIAKGEEYVVVDGFEEHPDLSFTKTVDLITSLHMLIGGRVDLVAGTRQVGEHWLRHHPKFTERPESSNIIFIEPALATQQMYMIFGNELDGNDSRVKLFDKAIARFVWSGKLPSLLTQNQLPEADRQNIITLLQEQFEKPTH